MNNHPYTKLAKEAVKEYLEKGSFISPDKVKLPSDAHERKAGVFVTIYRKDQLRGCIGTYAPTQESIAKEIVGNAIAASFRDPRFSPVSKKELDDLAFEVSVLEEPKQIKDVKELDEKKYGVIVKTSDGRSGLLLPDIPGVKTPEEQIQIASQKGGILPDEDMQILKFAVAKYS